MNRQPPFGHTVNTSALDTQSFVILIDVYTLYRRTCPCP